MSIFLISDSITRFVIQIINVLHGHKILTWNPCGKL